MGKKIQQPRTKGNVKPSTSEQAAHFLASKNLGNVEGFAGLAGGLGFMRADDMDPGMDPELRQIFRRLDKKDALTKQKALQELLTAVSEKEEASLSGALPYWPRLYSRLASDDDRKVRATTHKAMEALGSRCGKQLAPFLKTLLPVWIFGRGDDYDPAAQTAAASFEAVFPPAKRDNALRHAWEGVFSLAEEALNADPPSAGLGDSEEALATVARHHRAVTAALRALALVYPLVRDKESASSRLLALMRGKQFWHHYDSGGGASGEAQAAVAASSLIRGAYCELVVCLCREHAEFVRQPACAAAICEVVLRDISVDNPLVAGALWDAILSVIQTLGEQVWQHVSLKKSFLPKLNALLSKGGSGCARKIYPCLLPLCAQLNLAASAENRRVGLALLARMREGLALDRVVVARSEARAVAKAYMECCRFLIAEVRQAAPDELQSIVADCACDFYFTCLENAATYRHVLDLVADQLLQLFGFLQRHRGEAEFPAAVAALVAFLRDRCMLESAKQAIGVAALVEALATSGREAKKARGVGFAREEAPRAAEAPQMAPWAPAVMEAVAAALLEGVAWRHDDPGAWLPLLSALWRLEVAPLRQRFPDHFLTLRNGLPGLVAHFEAEREALQSHALFGAVIGGYCALLSDACAAPDEAAQLLKSHFGAMDERLRLAFLSRALQPLLDGLPAQMAAAVSASLEGEISAWSQSLLASVFVRLDDSAEAAFRGILDMLLHHVPPAMLGLWALRADLMAHVGGCLSALHADLCLHRDKCRHLVAMLCHLLDTCAEGDEAALEAILQRLNGFFLALLSFEGRTEDEEMVAAAKETILRVVRARLSCSGRGDELVANLVRTTVEGVCAAATDDVAVVLSEQYAVALFEQILRVEIEREDEAEEEERRALHRLLLSHLVQKAKTTYEALARSLTTNRLFHLAITSRDFPAFVSLVRCSFLLCALLPAAPSLEPLLEPRLLPRLVFSCLFLHSRFEALGLTAPRGSKAVEAIATCEAQRRDELLKDPADLTEGLEDCALRQLVLGDLLCRQEGTLPPQFDQLIDANAMRLEWLDAEEAEAALEIFIAKDLPYLLQQGPQVRDRLLAALTERLKGPSPGPALLSRLLRLMAACVALEPSLCAACLEEFCALHERDSSLLFPDDEEEGGSSAPSGPRLQSAVATMTLLRECVQHAASGLTEEQWDVILCNSAAWLSSYQLPSSRDGDSAEALNGQVFCFHLLRLLARLGSTLTDNETLPKRIVDEWKNFYVGLIYNAALTMFLDQPLSDVATPPPHWIVLCDAVAKIPAEHLLVFSIDTKLSIEEASQIEDKRVLTLINVLAPVLSSPNSLFCNRVAVACMLTTLARAGHFSVDAALAESVDEPTFELPQGLLLALEECEPVVARLVDTAAFGCGSAGLDCLADHGEEDEEDCSRSVELAHLCGYLLTWRVVAALFEASVPSVKAHHADRLLHSGRFDRLQQCLFRLLPLNPALRLPSQLRRPPAVGAKLAGTLSMFEVELPLDLDPTLPYMRRAWLQHLAASVYLQVLRVAPALVRHWWLTLRKKESTTVEKYTERLISPILVAREMEIVNSMAPSIFPDQDVVQVKGKATVREIQAIYQVTDEHRTELLITLPENYPLGAISVQTFKKIGISAQQWRSLQLQMTTFLKNQNGTVLEGLSLWKRNIDSKMEGVENCMICYSTIHESNYQLPRMTCRTCKKKFHVVCLYKWFQTSQNHTCPLCRNIFELSSARHGQSR